MRKLCAVLIMLVMVPMVFAASTVTNKPHDPNARTNPNPSTGPYVQPEDGRAFGDILMTIDLAAIGMPGDGYDNAGITSDGQYVYLINMYNNTVYVVDPSGPSVVTSWAAPASLAWGFGHETNPWITEYYSLSAYEYNWGGGGTGTSFYALQGGASWMGDISENWDSGELWIIAVGGSNKAYLYSLPAGTVIDSIGNAAWTSTSQRGFTHDPANAKFFLGGWNSDYVWETELDGTPTARGFAFTSIASLSYDYMPTVHPAPVLWLASNDATNYLYMIDPDNPVPNDTVIWDFETGPQGWTHTNGLAFPAGWAVQASGLHSNAMSPNPGDSSMWIDSDAAGSGTIVNDTCWSPWIIPTANTHWFKWGMGYQNYSSIDTFVVGIQVCVGGVWQAPVEVYRTQADIGPAVWDSSDVSAYNTADYIRLYFAYLNGDYCWYASFDNVFINGLIYTPGHDVGPTAFTNVPAMVPENTTISPTLTVKNHGNFDETFDVTCVISPGGYSSTQNVAALAPGATIDVTFDPFTFGSGAYTVTAYTQLVGDENPANDTLDRAVEASNWLYYDDGIAANAWAFYYMNNGFGVQFPVSMNWWVDSVAVHVWDTSWPSPGGTTTTLRLYDGASQPTNIKWEAANVTVVRGDWNKFACDTTLTHYAMGDNVYYMWIQAVDYPNCPGLSIDGATSQPGYMWYLLDGAFSVVDQGGDWLMRIHVIPETGVSEWISVTPASLALKAPTIVKSSTQIEFVVPVAGETKLVVYDASGRVCQTLVSGNLSAGTHTVSANLNLPAGVYFYNLTTSGTHATQKFLVVR